MKMICLLGALLMTAAIIILLGLTPQRISDSWSTEKNLSRIRC